MKISVSSQFFGYGPTSNLFSILRALKKRQKNLHVIALKNESINIFHSNHPGIIDEVSDENAIKYSDLHISSFDPLSLAISWAHNIPNIYYCNLLWYWDTHTCVEKIHHYRLKLIATKNKSIDAAIKYFKNIYQHSTHEGIYLGYLLADHAVTRNFPNIENHIQKLRSDTIITSNILIPPFERKKLCSKNTVLIQLSGGRNPVVTNSENNEYFSLIYNLVTDLAKIFTHLKFLIIANPYLLGSLNFIPNDQNNIEIKKTVSQDENLSLMHDALAILTSPGLETMYEAIYSDCPFFLLPEQNAGQYPNFTLLKSAGLNPYRFLIEELFPSSNEKVGEESIHSTYKILCHTNNRNNSHYRKMLRELKKFLLLIQNPENRMSYNSHIKSVIATYLPNDAFNAAEQITNLIQTKCFH